MADQRFDPTAPHSADEWFAFITGGNADAANLCMLVFDWINQYDHIIDRDVQGDAVDEVMHRGMWRAIVEIPANPFYQRHWQALAPSLENMICTWRASVTLQRIGTPKALEMAHVMRWIPAEFFLHCARLAAGKEWADTIAPYFWLAVGDGHSFEEFVAENKAAQTDEGA